MFLSMYNVDIETTNEQRTTMSAGNGSVLQCASDAIQKDLDTVMEILEEHQGNMPEGAYLRGMNALGSLHKHKRTTLTEMRPGTLLRCWKTLDEIQEDDEDIYDEIMAVADDIVVELCGDESSIYDDGEHNLVHRGDERQVAALIMNYKPIEGNAGYETSPMVLHHALQIIMKRLFDDTLHELDIVRPVSCQCGWRGVQGNWDRHVSNARHQRWVTTEHERLFNMALASAREKIVARRENGIVYIDEMHETPEVKIARQEAITEAERNGERVVFVTAHGEQLSWFA